MYKKELRKAIVANIEANKNSVTLNELYILSDLFRRRTDAKDYATLTEREWEQASLISTVLRIKDKRRIRNLRIVADAMERTK